ncbi:polysaccharide biosynthesis tyrosine autokinase [Paraburkholderia antibiotica]|uniref:Putative tyrosine-protein kinase EpsB n=1 Tax=Paraburkholderia antibiotica TaxID=2728839 RepID=A0A7X9X7C7_9BURK|nr:polysaccharide biosynthesis tyrosine autokinase [Paraburkholderia antibiotica]NML32434.1 polysaccharide biosynthesis tyrosine autokinase [Paraburkholderia antibiotica]
MKRYPIETTMPNYPLPAAEDEVSPVELWHNITSNKRLFLTIIGAFLALGLLYSVFAPPTYKANVLIQVDQQQASALGALSDVASALDMTKSLDGELDILNSRAVIGNAINATRADTTIAVANRFPVIGALYARVLGPQTPVAPAPFGLDSFAWGGERLKLTEFVLPSSLYGKNTYLSITSPDNWKLEKRDGTLMAHGRVGESVSFPVQTDDGVFNAKITLSELSGRPGTRFELEQHSLQSTIETLRKQLKVEETTKDSSMIQMAFKAKDPVLAANFANSIADAYVALNKAHRSEQARLSLQFLSGKLPALRNELEQSEDRLNRYRIATKTIDIEDQTEALLTQSAALIKQGTLVDLNLEAAKAQFNEFHPSVKALQAQKAAIDAMENTVSRQIEKLPATQQDYLRLARDVTVNTQLYTALLANSQQLEVAEAGTTGNVSVIDFAVSPEKADWPKPPIVMAGALIAGTLIAFITVQLIGSLRGSLRDPLQVERVANVPLYAVVPTSKGQTTLLRASRRNGEDVALLAESDPGDPSIEALRSLRGTLKFALVGAESNVVLFTGATQGLGKTFTSANFSYLLAINGDRVLVIDADMRRSGLANYFPCKKAGGLAEVLAGTVSLKDAIQPTSVDNLHVLSAGNRVPPNPSELLERPSFSALLREASAAYDYVVIDSPPVLPVSDAVTIAQQCSAVFLVVRSDVTSARQLTETINRLQRARVNVSGLVFNGFNAGRYGYGYGYGYSSTSTEPQNKRDKRRLS